MLKKWITSNVTQNMVEIMLDEYNDFTSYSQLPRDFGVAWAGHATLTANVDNEKIELLQDRHISIVSRIVDYSLSERMVDETH